MIKNRNSKVNVTLAITLWLIASHYVAHHGLNLGPILSHFGYHLHSDDLTRLDQSQREMIEQRFKSRKASLRLAYPVLLFLAEKKHHPKHSLAPKSQLMQIEHHLYPGV